VNKEATKTRDKSYQVNANRTGYNGGESSGTKSVTRNENGSRSIDGNYNTQKGNTIKTSATATKTADGVEKSGSYTTSNGKSSAQGQSNTKTSSVTVNPTPTP